MFDMARRQFERIADHLQIPEDERDRLLLPKRTIAVFCPIHQDDGSTGCRGATVDNVGRIKSRTLAEGANGPTTPEADAVLEARGDVFVLPDILCNPGGVVVS